MNYGLAVAVATVGVGDGDGAADEVRNGVLLPWLLSHLLLLVAKVELSWKFARTAR